MIDIDRIAIEAIEERIKMPISEISTGNETMFVSSAVMATVKALSVLQKEYEEKLRWIPIEEKDAPNEVIQMKLENGEIRFGFFTDKIKTTSNFKGFINVTHYRTLSFYNAT